VGDDLAVVARFLGMDPTPERLHRLAFAMPLLDGTIGLLSDQEGADDAPPARLRDLPFGLAKPVNIPDVEPCELGVLEAAQAIREGWPESPRRTT
jgi:hypothetical protein